MRKVLTFTLIVTLVLTSCKKEQSSVNTQIPEPQKQLSAKQKEVVQRFEHASYILSSVLSDKQMRNEFNQFILAKVKKSGTDEELTFKEIFSAKSVNLAGVRSDFLVRFRDALVNTFISGKYRHAEKFNIKFQSPADVEKYFVVIRGASSTQTSQPNRVATNDVAQLEVPDGYEIYYPYSENFEGTTYNYYAVSYNPITTMEENAGERFDYNTGTYVDIVPVDDNFAFGTPTYIVTYDDGLNTTDFVNGSPVGTENYKIMLTDDEYNPLILQKHYY